MKYSNQIEINLPLNRVIELFDNPDNMQKWMPGLQSYEHLSGDPGQPGAKTKLHFIMGKRDMEMVETITKRELPGEFSGTYETKGVLNIQQNHFEETGPNSTTWISHNEFRFKGLMALFMPLMKGAFKKQSAKFQQYFKDFAEEQG